MKMALMGNSIKNIENTDALELIINSGIYRHHTLRKQMRDVFLKTGSTSDWDTLKTTHWEILYYLIEYYLLNRAVTITDIPLGVGYPETTSRRSSTPAAGRCWSRIGRSPPTRR